MNISLDYDNTYTLDPEGWDAVVDVMKLRGHKVYVVTLRTPSEGDDVRRQLSDKAEAIIFTSRGAKADCVQMLGISIDVWIDDMPWFIYNDARPV